MVRADAHEETGKFIVIDGCNGSGKGTQIAMIADTLASEGYEVVVTREPGGTPIAESLRELLLAPRPKNSDELSKTAEILLFFAARAQNVEVRVRPALRRGAIVLCDRFTPSTIAFQCFGLGYPLAKVQELEKLTLEGFKPDRVIVLDLDPMEGLRRNQIRQDVDSIEKRGRQYLDRARIGFLHQAKDDPATFKVVDASLSVDQVFNVIMNEIRNII